MTETTDQALDPPRRTWLAPLLGISVAVLAFLLVAARGAREERPRWLVVRGRVAQASEVTLLVTASSGAVTRATLPLVARRDFSKLEMPLPESEIVSVGVELSAGADALEIERMLLLDGEGRLSRKMSLKNLEPVGATELDVAEALARLARRGPDPPAAVLDLGLLYAGGPSTVAALWIVAAGMALAIAANLPRSPLPRLLGTPLRARAAAGLAAAAVLATAAVMALTSPVGAHPDEVGHLMAARYYGSAWLPAPIGSAALEPTIMVGWGRSYLFELDVVYFFAGKFGALTGLELPAACRLFQWLLLATLLGLAVRLVPTSPALALACALTPQAWYVGSYFNGDAWPLVFAFAVAALLAHERPLARLASHERRERMPRALVLGALLGVLLVSKTNYWIFVAWALVVTALALRARAQRLGSRLSATLALVAGTALAIFLLRYGYEQALNDFERGERIARYVETHADPRYRHSSLDSGAARPGMYLRERGKPFLSLFSRSRWLYGTTESALGVYGCMTITGPPAQYWSAGAAALLAVALLSAATWRSREPGARAVLLVSLLFCAGVVLQSGYFSWTVNFQPQGRYLFPLLPILAVALAPGARRLPGRVLAPLVLVPFALSLWSFATIGVPRLLE